MVLRPRYNCLSGALHLLLRFNHDWVYDKILDEWSKSTIGNVLTLPEQRFILENVSWETYEHLLSDHLDTSAPRFTFDRGRLEITRPSSEHEELPAWNHG